MRAASMVPRRILRPMAFVAAAAMVLLAAAQQRFELRERNGSVTVFERID